MPRVMRMAVFATLVAALGLTVTTTVASAKPPPVVCHHHNKLGQCVVTVRSSGHGGGRTGGPGRGGVRCTDAWGQTIPCRITDLGTWDQGLQCYLKLIRPQPPKFDPVWRGHTGGVVYMCTVWPPRTTGGIELWFAAPPATVNPRVLALRAARQLVLPRPSGHRSPSASQSFDGYPFTYVNLWTWFWTDSGTWRTRSVTSRAGAVSATVTVTPTRLTFDPGDGSPTVSCQGPGKPWTSSDGNAAPPAGACAYRYRSVTSTPVTSTQTIRWSVTWTASDGTSGRLPDLTTSRAGRLMVLQIQSVVSQ
jgi:hypothetical protein